MGKRIAVVGTRFNELYDKLWEQSVREFVDSLPEDAEIVVAGAPGVDQMAARLARERGLSVTIMFPDAVYSQDPRYFMHHNRSIVQQADEVHAFWDGESPGTHHAIVLARYLKVPCRVHYVHNREWQLIR